MDRDEANAPVLIIERLHIARMRGDHAQTVRVATEGLERLPGNAELQRWGSTALRALSCSVVHCIY